MPTPPPIILKNKTTKICQCGHKKTNHKQLGASDKHSERVGACRGYTDFMGHHDCPCAGFIFDTYASNGRI